MNTIKNTRLLPSSRFVQKEIIRKPTFLPIFLKYFELKNRTADDEIRVFFIN